MSRHRRRRLAALFGTAVERIKAWATSERAGMNYGRAKRVVRFLATVTVAAVIGEVVAWLLHGR